MEFRHKLKSRSIEALPSAVASIPEPPVASVAGKGSLARVRAHVGLVDVLVRKLAPAERARVHVVARMQIHVHPDVVPGMKKLSKLNNCTE